MKHPSSPRFSYPLPLLHIFAPLVSLIAAVILPGIPCGLAQNASPNTPDHRNTSTPAVRAIMAHVTWTKVGWDESQQKPSGKPILIQFSGPAAPIDLIGKPALPKSVTLSPEIPGIWRWESSDRLVFEPQADWLPPQRYSISFGPEGFATDCKITFDPKHPQNNPAQNLSCSIEGQSFYIDPTSPTLQRAVASVLFSHPVALQEVSRYLRIVNLTDSPLFASGGKPQVIADTTNPLRFWLRSPLVKISDKEDLVRFEITPGISALCGGNPLKETVFAKVTVPSRHSGFTITKTHSQIIFNSRGEPRQFLFIETKGKAAGKEFAKYVEAWHLPPPSKNKDDVEIPWTKENVTAAVLAKAKRVPLEFVPDETGKPVSEIFGFKLQPQVSETLFVRIPKETPAPGGFSTPEDFADLVTVPEFTKEAWVTGQGGILALNGERKLNIKSRGYDHLRFTIARVPEHKINLFASQARGRFETPQFRGSFGFEDISHYSQSIQEVPKTNDYEPTFSKFDFSPLLNSSENKRGLFYLTVQGVRPRSKEDGPASSGDPDPQWIALTPPPSNHDEDNYGRYNRYSFRDNDDDAEVEFDRNNATQSVEPKVSDARFVLLTDLGLIIKANADGSRDVFVQSFQNQSPIEGVHLSAIARNGDTLVDAHTDSQGHAVLPSLNGLQREKEPVALVARKADDLAFIAWERSDRRVQTSRFDVGGIQSSDGAALNAFLFTERGIYRPGDTIQLAAIVRQRNWSGSLAGLPLEVVVFNAKDEEAGRFPVKLPPDGFLTLTIPTTETVPTGVWRILLQLPSPTKTSQQATQDSEQPALGQILVRVEEFQPDRLKMNAFFDASESLLWRSPENLQAHIALNTLFGIPAADRRITGKMKLSPAEPRFDQWPGWSFGLPKSPHFEPKEIDLGETETDENGTAKFDLPFDAQIAPLLKVSLEMEGFEADGGRGVQIARSTLVSRQPFLLGYKADGDTAFVPVGTPRTLDLSAIGSDSKAVRAEHLKQVLIETRHASVLTKQQNGTLAYVSQPVEQELESKEVSFLETVSSLKLPTKNIGSFRYEWRDMQGTTLLAVPFSVVGAGDSNRSLERSSELQISLPSKDWKPGEELEVSVRAPFTGAGLITIEREKVLASSWFKSDKASSVQHITVPEGIEGGAYVHVTYVRGLDSPDIFATPLSSGIAPFRVAEDRRTLPITISAPAKASPGDTFKVRYSTPRPSRILIWAVDEGIHRVTSYQAPAPLSRLLSKPALEVNTYQLVDLLMPEFTLLKNALATGGDGEDIEPPELNAGLNPFKRKRVAPVIFWSEILPCGPNPQEITYQIPDYFAGGLNIMAVALDTDSVGVAKEHAIVKGPFVLTPNAPFFAAPGDEFTASVTVANQLEGASITNQITVKAEVDGGLEIVEHPAELVEIAPNKEATLHFRCRAKDTLGNAEIKFSAQAGTERIEQRSTMSIRPATPRSAIVQSGWFRSDSHEVNIDHDFHSQFSKREVVVSTTPLGLAKGLAAYLREYPFGCSEQITSRAFPWLVLRDDANFGLDKTEATKAIQGAIAQLAKRQGQNGGFGYWYSDSAEGFDYVSVYVTQFLTEARAAGFHVPVPMFDSALRRVRLMADAKLTEPYKSPDGVVHYERTRYDANMRAAAIYLLTRNEEVTTKYAIKLADSLKALVPEPHWLGDPSAAWLAATWRLLKKDDEATRLIQAHLAAKSKPRPYGEWVYYYESPLTLEATTFTVLCRHFPEIAGKFSYDELKPITEMVEKGLFHTLSAAWSVQALKAYSLLAQNSGLRVGIAQGGTSPKTIVEPRAGMASATLSPGIVRLLLERNSDSKLGAWYQTIETGFERVLPTEPESRSLDVKREFLTESEDPTDSAKVGETLLVRITVRNTGRSPQPNLALSELLPCAFDFAPNSDAHALKPGLNTLEGADYIDIREDRALLFYSLESGETKTFTYSVRPTCPGTFAVPPAYAESMYDRGVHAHGVANKFTVLPRE
ncbi:MAG: MG2 domain-containing protein [Verrucomicrobiota bacterium]